MHVTHASARRVSQPRLSFFLSFFFCTFPGSLLHAPTYTPQNTTEYIDTYTAEYSTFLWQAKMSSLCTPLKVTADTTKRRRFQPPITTFFSSPANHTSSSSTTSGNSDATIDTNSATGRVSHYHYSAVTSSATPVVPARVQSSLLSVGMRVRKSIADGYKTKGSFLGASAESKMYQSQSRSVSGSSVGENSDADDIITDDGDAYSLPSSSQESVSSGLGIGRKRTLDYEEEDDDDEDGYNGPQIGRTILAPSLVQQRQRLIALKHHHQHHQTTIVAAGAGGMDVDDFEEAAFLRRREDVDV